MNSWFTQLNQLIALRESGDISDEDFQDHKQRLWRLEQALTGLGQRIDASKVHIDNAPFQMRLMGNSN